MEKETTQVDEGLEAVIADMKEQVGIIRRNGADMNAAFFSYKEGVIITGNDAIKLIEFYNKHSKQD